MVVVVSKLCVCVHFSSTLRFGARLRGESPSPPCALVETLLFCVCLRSPDEIVLEQAVKILKTFIKRAPGDVPTFKTPGYVCEQ